MLAVSGRKRDNRYKLKQERSQLDARKKTFHHHEDTQAVELVAKRD